MTLSGAMRGSGDALGGLFNRNVTEHEIYRSLWMSFRILRSPSEVRKNQNIDDAPCVRHSSYRECWNLAANGLIRMPACVGAELL